MKSFKILLAGSLVANLALIAAVVSKPSLMPSAVRDFFHLHDAKAEAAQRASQRAAAEARAATDRAAASRALLWSALASDDLPTFVTHLRAAGFSPGVIRAIASSQIDQRFRTRMKELVGTFADTPFWKPEPANGLGTPKIFEAYNQIYRERARLLRELLGDDLFAGTSADPTVEKRRQYGSLSKAKIDLIQRINEDYAEMTAQVTSATQGIMLPEDRAKLVLLEREKQVDLAALLSPQELADYQMRSSRLTGSLRTPLSIMDATETEFLAIYRVMAPYADVLYPSSSVGYSDEQFQQRSDARQKVADQLKQVLGAARYADYTRASSTEFQQLCRLTQQENLPTDTAVRTFDLRDAAANESWRIYNDRSLDLEQKRAALQALAQNTSAQIVGTLGANAGNAYVKSARWLSNIEQGGAVTFSPDGSGTTYWSLPPPRAVSPSRN